MTYISYVSKNRICEGDFGIAEYASPERAKEVLNDKGIKRLNEPIKQREEIMSVLNKILLPNLRFNKRPIMRYGHALLLIFGYWSD